MFTTQKQAYNIFPPSNKHLPINKCPHPLGHNIKQVPYPPLPITSLDSRNRKEECDNLHH